MILFYCFRRIMFSKSIWRVMLYCIGNNGKIKIMRCASWPRATLHGWLKTCTLRDRTIITLEKTTGLKVLMVPRPPTPEHRRKRGCGRPKRTYYDRDEPIYTRIFTRRRLLFGNSLMIITGGGVSQYSPWWNRDEPNDLSN